MRDRLVVEFEVSGATLDELDAQAHSQLTRLDGKLDWRWTLDVRPAMRSGAGDTIAWVADVRAVK